MKALIFAAGIGSRLKPFTDKHPKALVSVGGVTMLERTIRRICDAGADRIVVNVHHLASQIIDFLRLNDNFGADIVVSDESCRLLDTGGGLLKAKALLDADSHEPILLHNADILTDIPLHEIVETHLRSDADVTLLVSDRQSSRGLCFDEMLKMKGWRNLTTGEIKPESLYSELARVRTLAFGGVHVLNTSVFQWLERYAEKHGDVFSITAFYIDVVSQIDIRGMIPSVSYMWHDIGTPEKLAHAEIDLLLRRGL